MISVVWLGSGASAAIVKASSSDGTDSITSTMRITTESTAAAERAGQDAEDQAADQAEDGGEDPDDEGLAAAHEQPREQVPTAVVGAQREARLGAGHGIGLRADLVEERRAAGSCGAIQGEMTARTMKATVMARPNEEHRVAAQPSPRAGDQRDPGGLVDGGGGEGVDALLAAPGVRRFGHGVTSS